MQSQAVGLDAVETGKLAKKQLREGVKKRAKKQLREGVKKRVFYSQADPKGGGGGHSASTGAQFRFF